MMVIIGFALLFTLFDVLEASHQLGAARSGLALIAAMLAVLHVVTALLALRLVTQARGARLASG